MISFLIGVWAGAAFLNFLIQNHESPFESSYSIFQEFFIWPYRVYQLYRK